MSRFLTIECDPIDQPAANDPVERRTWCALRIRVGGRTVTRMWDKTLEDERSLLYLPAFPIAEWLVENWWALLNEPCPTPELPKPLTVHHAWIKRHCLRAADSAICLPALFFFNDGRGVSVEWRADEPDAFANMPGEFTDSGVYHLEKGPAELILAEFVSEILQRVDDLSDERVVRMKEAWRAVQNADAEETAFCVAAGRMGLDPYDPALVSEDLAAFLENILGDPELPLARDLTETAQPDSVADQWAWVQQAKVQWQVGPMAGSPPLSTDGSRIWPSKHGYHLAALARQQLGLMPSDSLPSIEATAHTLAKAPLHTPEQNHIPGSGVRAAVGWNAAGAIVVAGPRPQRSDNQRFLDARGLYHALFACDRSERLLTDAFTWDQQASRAFAAELLAPQAALTAQTGPRADRGKIEELANTFGASTLLIERQLENAGVALIDE